MISKVLLRVASTRFYRIFLLYISSFALTTAFGAVVLYLALKMQGNAVSVGLFDILIQSAANTLSISSIYFDISSHLIAVIGLAQGLAGVILNGLFGALIVFRILRINHNVMTFANHVLLSKQQDGNYRLEFRICNDSKHDMINMSIKVQMVEMLESFPSSTAHKTSEVVLNYDKYLFLDAHGYLLVSSSTAPASENDGRRIADIGASLLSRRFYLRVLVEGQFLDSEFTFSQFRRYDGRDVHKGHWRYYLQEDLEKKGKLLLDKFSAFDGENNEKRHSTRSKSSSKKV